MTMKKKAKMSNGVVDSPPSSGRSIQSLTTQEEEMKDPERAVMVTPKKTTEDRSGTTAANFKLFLLLLMVLQNSSTVLVGRYTRTVPAEELYEVNHLILVSEVGKFLLSSALEFYTTNGNLLQSLQVHVFQKPVDALKILVPALLYLLQNNLLYVALGNLTAPIFQVTYQCKLVTTALVSVIMLQRKYSLQQWICLTVLSIGVAIVVLGEKKDDDGKKQEIQQNLLVGLTAVTIACMSSALAGVYFEKVLKKPGDTGKEGTPQASLWMRNIQLSFFSIIVAASQGGFKDTGKPYLHGFSTAAWVLVGLQAGGGLLVAAVIKYADNVLKGLATGVSVVVATAFSMVFFGTEVTAQFFTGAALILTSVYFFSNPLPARFQPKTKTERDDDDALQMTEKLVSK
jgi:UDP-sugar transporter A1/2/3